MAQPPRNVPAPASKKPAVPEVEAEEPTSRLRWLLGWVVSPSLFFGGIFLGGVYLGANRPEGWVTRTVTWVVGVF